MKELQPINQNIVLDITEDKKEYKTAGGIIIPDTVEKEKQNIAKVVAVSNIDNSEISIGDVVLYKEYNGNEIELEDKKFLIIQYDDVLAKIVETDEI